MAIANLLGLTKPYGCQISEYFPMSAVDRAVLSPCSLILEHKKEDRSAINKVQSI